MTHLRQIMLEELERRNYALGTITSYIRTVEHFAQHFHRAPDQLDPGAHSPVSGSHVPRVEPAPPAGCQSSAGTALAGDTRESTCKCRSIAGGKIVAPTSPESMQTQKASWNGKQK